MGLKWLKHISAAVEQRKNNPGKIMDKNNHTFDAYCYLADSRPMSWVKPREDRAPGVYMDDLLKLADERQAERERPNYGIRCA